MLYAQVCVFVCLCVVCISISFQPWSQLADLYEILYGSYAIRGHPNFMHSDAPTNVLLGWTALVIPLVSFAVDVHSSVHPPSIVQFHNILRLLAARPTPYLEDQGYIQYFPLAFDMSSMGDSTKSCPSPPRHTRIGLRESGACKPPQYVIVQGEVSNTLQQILTTGPTHEFGRCTRQQGPGNRSQKICSCLDNIFVECKTKKWRLHKMCKPDQL